MFAIWFDPLPPKTPSKNHEELGLPNHVWEQEGKSPSIPIVCVHSMNIPWYSAPQNIPSIGHHQCHSIHKLYSMSTSISESIASPQSYIWRSNKSGKMVGWGDFINHPWKSWFIHQNNPQFHPSPITIFRHASSLSMLRRPTAVRLVTPTYPNSWMVDFRENPIRRDDDWGSPYFRKPPYLALRILKQNEHIQFWEVNKVES